MIYYVVFNPNSRNSYFLTNSNGFVEKFDDYSDALNEAKMNIDMYEEFVILVECSDDKHDLI